MNRCLTFLILLLGLLGATGGVWAQGYWRDLPPDERRQMRQQMREHWQQEREVRRDEGASRWRDMPQEDRRRLRDDLREQRAWPDQRGGHEGRGRGGRRD